MPSPHDGYKNPPLADFNSGITGMASGMVPGIAPGTLAHERSEPLPIRVDFDCGHGPWHDGHWFHSARHEEAELHRTQNSMPAASGAVRAAVQQRLSMPVPALRPPHQPG